MTDKKGSNPNRLNGKDLINAGIFSAIYVVIIIAVACTLGLIPIGFLLLNRIQRDLISASRTSSATHPAGR